MAEADVRAALKQAWAIMQANDSCDHTMCRAPDPRNLDRSCLAQRIADALVAAHVDAGARGERARAIEECAQVVMRQRARNDGGIVTIQAANHALRVAAECIRELLPPAAPGARERRRHVEDARYYVNAESCETCAMPERDGPCYRCAVRAVQAALDAALLPPAAPEEKRDD